MLVEVVQLEVEVDEDAGTVILSPDSDLGPSLGPEDDRTPMQPGDRIGRYQLDKRLGSGGMGVVWVAHDPRLERTVAVKVLHERRRRGASLARERLRREALALARLSHPNVVAIYDVGIHDGRVFLAMEHIEGRTLDRWLARGPSFAQIIDVFGQAAAGLAAVHEAGFVHRDFKPTNVMIDREGRVAVMDFGLARIYDPDSVSEHDASVSAHGASAAATFVDGTTSWPTEATAAFSTVLTCDGVIMGTPAYMAPEQHVGQGADARADQFSFCATLFEALVGRRPFEGRTVKELAQDKHRRRLDFAGSERPIRAGLRRLLRRGLDPEPARRFPDMVALRRCLVERSAPRRRPLSVAVFASALVMGTAGWAGWDRLHTNACDGGADRMAQLWSDDERAQLHRSFSATEVSYADDAAHRTAARLDAYAGRWATMFHDACVTADDQGRSDALDLRMVCLNDAETSMASTLELLLEADATTVQRAVGQVAGLPTLSRCGDLDALGAQVALPSDPQALAAIEGIRRQLERARALDRAGRYRQARGEAQAALGQAQAQGHDPSIARARIRIASCDQGLGNALAAQQGLTEATLLAAGIGDHQAAADGATRLVYVSSEDVGRPHDALRWARHAEASLARMPEDPLARARLDGHLGIVYSTQGHYAQALDHFERAYAAKREILGEDHPEVAAALENIGLNYGEQGRLVEAEQIHRRSLDTLESVLGSAHPDFAHSLMNLGHTVDLLGRHDEAAELFTRALGVEREALGSRHPMVARTLAALGGVASVQDRLLDAEAYYRQAAEIIEASFGERHHEHAWLIHDQAIVTSQLGRNEEALELFARSREVLEAFHGADHDAIAHLLMSEAISLLQLSRLAEAEAVLDRASSIVTARLPADHPTHGRYQMNRGELLHAQGRLKEAHERLMVALGIVSTGLGPEHPETASVLLLLGQLEHERKHDPEAVQHLRRAYAITESAPVGIAFRSAVRFALAQALWPDPASRAECQTLAAQAREGFAGYGATFDEDLSEIDAWQQSHRGG